MITDRRNFIKATAGVSLLGASDAHAAANDPWIGFLHSTILESDWELDFFKGLSKQNYQADPTEATGGKTRVNILSRHINGKYKKRNPGNINLAMDDILATIPNNNLKLIVAAGGLIVAQPAAKYLQDQGKSIPLVTAVGRKDSNNWSNYANVEGIFFDDVSTGTNTNMARKVSDLTDTTASGQYKIPKEKICFLYNKNSGIGEAELGELNDILSLGHDPLNVEASRGGENGSIKLAKAFNDIPAVAKAVILSADPYFTRHMSEIVRLAASKSNQFMLCYPLLDYGDEAVAAGMSTAQFMARGPRLKDVGDATKGLYLALGELAGARLAAPAGQYGFKPAAQGYIGLP